MKKQLRQLAVQLRISQNLSYSEIKGRLGVPKSTLSYWLKNLPLEESKIKELQKAGWKKSEASRERYRNTMKEKRLAKDQVVYENYDKMFCNLSNQAAFVAGLMLYLAEGSKNDYTKIVLANTDYKIIQFFISWLIEFLQVKKEKIKIQLHLYNNMDLEKEQNFWQNRLELEKTQFYKTQVRELKASSFTYKDSKRHGTCSVYVLGVEKKRQVTMAIKAFLDNYLKNKGV